MGSSNLKDMKYIFLVLLSFNSFQRDSLKVLMILVDSIDLEDSNYLQVLERLYLPGNSSLLSKDLRVLTCLKKYRRNLEDIQSIGFRFEGHR